MNCDRIKYSKKTQGIERERQLCDEKKTRKNRQWALHFMLDWGHSFFVDVLFLCFASRSL